MAVITISRLPGALAAALAEHFHYRLVERTQLVQLAEQLVGRTSAGSARLNCASACPPSGSA